MPMATKVSIAATIKAAWEARPKTSEIATSVAAIVATLMYWDTQYGASAKATKEHRNTVQNIRRNAAEQTQEYRKEKLKKKDEILKKQDEIYSSKWFWRR